MSIQYAVHWGDWLPDFPEEENEEAWIEWWGSTEEADVSDKIDDRTEKSRLFDSEEEALTYAKNKLNDRRSDKWLAYLEIKKCTVEVIEKLK